METMTFGKYRGQAVMDVIDMHPWYIIWACKNTHFKLDEWQKKELNARLGRYDRNSDEFSPVVHEELMRFEMTVKTYRRRR